MSVEKPGYYPDADIADLPLTPEEDKRLADERAERLAAKIAQRKQAAEADGGQANRSEIDKKMLLPSGIAARKIRLGVNMDRARKSSAQGDYAQVKQADVDSGEKMDLRKFDERIKKLLNLFDVETKINLQANNGNGYRLEFFIKKDGNFQLDRLFQGTENNIMKQLAMHMAKEGFKNKQP